MFKQSVYSVLIFKLDLNYISIILYSNFINSLEDCVYRETFSFMTLCNDITVCLD